MLDDLKMIHERDAQDALGVAGKQWQQLTHDYQVKLPPFENVANVVLAGMGGSALPAVFLGAWPGVKVPFEIVRNYNLPGYVNRRTLFIAASYSGNTEETLSALAEAEAKDAQIAVITAGGRLAEQAKQKDYPTFTIPTGIQPRMCAFYFLAALIQLLEPSDLVAEGSLAELRETAGWLGDRMKTWSAEVPGKDNPAKQ